MYTLFALLLLLEVFREKVVILEVAVGLSLTHRGEEIRDGSPVAARVPLKLRKPTPCSVALGSVPNPVSQNCPARQRNGPVADFFAQEGKSQVLPIKADRCRRLIKTAASPQETPFYTAARPSAEVDARVTGATDRS